MTEKIKVKLNVALLNYRQGETITLEAKDGVPINKYWARRIKDSVIDNCITILTDLTDNPEVIKAEKFETEIKHKKEKK